MTDLTRQRVNYDAIAHLYDEPRRDYDVDANLLEFLQEHDLDPADLAILDLGCGTGKQLTANRARFPNMMMVGLDLFVGMLRQAQKRCAAVAWTQGDSAAPPFPAGQFHYITNQFSYHQVQRKAAMIAGVYRLLRPNGRFVLTNIDPWAMPEWIIYHFFPAARTRDERDFLPVERLIQLMTEVGFVNVRVGRRRQVVEEDLRQFLAYASDRFRTSQFMALADTDYSAGLEAISDLLAVAGDQSILIPSEFCLITITGDKLT